MHPLDIEKFGDSAIAVIGMSGRFPGADTIDAFWYNLKNGVESVSFFTDEELIDSGIDPALLKKPNYVKAKAALSDIDWFDAAFFGFNPREASLTDVQHRIFLECAWQALETAGYAPETYKGLIGVYAGSGMNTYFLRQVFPSQNRIAAADAYQMVISNDKDFLTTLVSYKLNLKGPSVCIQTACSTSLVAIHIACQGLLNGECDMALAGGVSVDVPHKSGYLYEEGMILSPDGHCRAFDAKAGGTVSGNGCAIVVLKRLKDAVTDRDYIWTVIRGTAINNDGSLKVGFTAPSVDGQAGVISEAQAVANVEPESITYIEAHGTGTTLGDPIEIAALTQAFGTSKTGFCAIGSVKTNIGHLDTAAGAAGLIKAALALKYKQIPPSLNFEQPNPKIAFADSPFYVNATLTEWKTDGIPRRAGVSSFGIGGTNAHAVLEEFPDQTSSLSRRPYHLLTLSARSDTALDAASQHLADHFRNHLDQHLADVAFTLQTGRRQFNHRRIAVCRDLRDAETALRTSDPQRVFTQVQDAENRPVVFMFPGQGSQYVHMGWDLYQTEPIFRQQVDRCSDILKPHLKADLRQILYGQKADWERQKAEAQLMQTGIAQSVLFVIEYALAQLWMAWGIRPQAMIGHSIGEYTAACLAGVFSVEDALLLVAERGQMMQKMPPGAMLAVPLPEADVQALIADTPALSIAAVNAPSLCVVSGRTDVMDALEKRLSGQGTECRRLHTSHAFHSDMMEPVVMPFMARVCRARLNRPQIPYISNVTGTWITDQEAADPGYWSRHLRRTVRFSDGVRELLKTSGQVLLEVGPGRTLGTLAMQQPSKTPQHVILNSMRHPQDNQSDSLLILTTLGKLWLSGVAIDWSKFHAQESRLRVPLPTYPFERKRYWIDAPQPSADNLQPELGKKPDIADWFYIPSWKRKPLLVLSDGEENKMASVLVFANECDICSRIVSRLKQDCPHVITVSNGVRFLKTDAGNYLVNPKHHEDYEALVNELVRNSLPTTIVHLWNISEQAPSSEIEKRLSALDSGLYSLLSLAQAIGNHSISDPIRIFTVSNGMQDVAGEAVAFPEKAALLGPVKIIPLEYPAIQCCSIDAVIPEHGSREEQRLVEQLMAEFASEICEPVIALRGMHRWVQTVEPVRLESPDPKLSRLRQKGVYLITGGFGGMGLAFAEYLGKTKQANLILLGRSAFPQREEWDVWLETRDPQDKISAVIRTIRDIESSGGQVLTFSADVANESEIREAIAQATSRFGNIHGVIHAAGLADYAGIIQRRTRTMTEDVLAPKVKGTLVLDRVLEQEPLDFFMVCSSLSTTLYRMNFGQVGYQAANEFLDAFALHKTCRDNVVTVSVNWDNWQEVGMSVDALKRRRGKELNVSDETLRNFVQTGILPSEGSEVLRRSLESRLSRVLVSTQELTLLMKQAQPFSELPAPSGVSGFTSERPELASVYTAPENAVQQMLTEVWQELLGIREIGIHDSFFDLGGHSLIAVRLISQIEEKTGVKFAPAEIYHYPTIKALAEQIRSKMSGKMPGTRTFEPPIIGIQPYGDQVPFFFMHAAEGNVFCYNELSRELGMNQPFYGLKAFGIDPNTSFIPRVDELIETYVNAIRRIQPKGPYILGGHCLGGAIAYSAALRIQQHGGEVVRLIIIDGYAPPLFRRIAKDDVVMDLLEFSQTITGPFNVELFPFYCDIRKVNSFDGVEGVYRDFQTLSYQERLELLQACIQRTGLNLDMDTDYLDRAFKVYRSVCSMFRSYEVMKPYTGSVVFFRAKDEPQRPTDDPTLGWREYASDIRVYDIPGNHFTVLTKPNVRVLADHLKQLP